VTRAVFEGYKKRFFFTRSIAMDKRATFSLACPREILRVKEASMSCPYYKVGYFGVCAASTSMYIPGIDEMESHCFNDDYRLCLNLSASLSSQQIVRSASPEGAGKEHRTLIG
jgi:hypothetical protein